jgi:hypothetical protein
MGRNVSGYVKNVWDGASLSARGAIGRTNWTVAVGYSLGLILIVSALWLYAKLNRYEYLQTREYSEGEYSILRFDRLRGRLEECVVPGIDGTFRDRSQDQAMCLTYRANSVPADRTANN